MTALATPGTRATAWLTTVWEWFSYADGSVGLAKLWYASIRPEDGESRFLGLFDEMTKEEAVEAIRRAGYEPRERTVTRAA